MATNTQFYRWSGFLKAAQEQGYTQQQAAYLWKQKVANDPSMMGGDPSQAGGMPPQGGMPPGPQDASLPQPPPDGAAPTANPELAQLEQLLQSLPPEQLEQIIQQIQAELQGGGGDPSQAGGDPSQAGGDPSQMGGMPPQGDPSQMGGNPDEMVAKQADYIGAFADRGYARGYSQPQIAYLYKKALALFDPAQAEQVTKVAQDQQADTYEQQRIAGFFKRAAEQGFTRDQAVELYQSRVAK